MEKASTLEIIALQPSLIGPLSELFAEIKQKGESDLFHPHPFTLAEAKRLCHDTGQDIYYALILAQRILGYGMLRGWNEGYVIPSLGIYIRPEARGKGLGKLLMLHLHAAAQLRGAEKIRLKVYKENYIAQKLYENLGYVFEREVKGQWIGLHNLTKTPRR